MGYRCPYDHACEGEEGAALACDELDCHEHQEAAEQAYDRTLREMNEESQE